VYPNKHLWKGTQIFIKGCKEFINKEAKSFFLVYRKGNYRIIESTVYGEVI